MAGLAVVVVVAAAAAAVSWHQAASRQFDLCLIYSDLHPLSVHCPASVALVYGTEGPCHGLYHALFRSLEPQEQGQKIMRHSDGICMPTLW